MPEPVTLIVGGVALYAWIKGRQQTAQLPANATPGAALAATANSSPIAVASGSDIATNTSLAAQAGGGGIATIGLSTDPVASSLTAALDNDSAMMMRAYAALNPADFQMFLDRYADQIVLRNDMYLERLTNPNPADPVQPTPAMLVSLGSAAYKVVQALNGVAAGRSVDVFGLSASVAGQLPGLNPDFVTSLQALAMGYRAISSLTQVMNLAAANGVSVLNFSAMVGAGAYPGLAALPLSGVLMAAGLVVDIVFTIIGDAPDMQKAIDVALDVASLAVLFIPVIGVVIAIVIQLVKFIIDLFGSDLFGGGLSHAQREALETARYGQNLNPMFPELADAYTPRELQRAIYHWTSGYCGGVHVIAMAVNLVLKEGDIVMVAGRPVTITAAMGTGAPVLLPDGTTGVVTLGIGDNGANGGQCYWLKGSPFEMMTNDEMAWALAKYASVNGIIAEAQAGIREDLKTQFNVPVQNTIMARSAPMKNFIDHGLSLDQIDQVALEYRAQPHLALIATSYGWPDWQSMLGDLLAIEWAAFQIANSHGSLSDFARSNGFRTMYAFRASAMASYADYVDRWTVAQAQVAADLAASIADYNSQMVAVAAAQQAFTSGGA